MEETIEWDLLEHELVGDVRSTRIRIRWDDGSEEVRDLTTIYYRREPYTNINVVLRRGPRFEAK